jgi:hypothetical protein
MARQDAKSWMPGYIVTGKLPREISKGQTVSQAISDAPVYKAAKG